MGTNILGTTTATLQPRVVKLAEDITLSRAFQQRIFYDLEKQDFILTLPPLPELGDTIFFERYGTAATLPLGVETGYSLTIRVSNDQKLWGNTDSGQLNRAVGDFSLTWDGTSWV